MELRCGYSFAAKHGVQRRAVDHHGLTRAGNDLETCEQVSVDRNNNQLTKRSFATIWRLSSENQEKQSIINWKEYNFERKESD